MKRSVVLLFIALLAVPVFAGCLGGDDTPKTGTDDGVCDAETDPNCKVGGTIEEGLGGIKGTILDDNLLPVANANVTLRANELTDEIKTKTTEEGVYAFNNLEPGSYQIFALKYPTHLSKAIKVDVVANEHAGGDLVLELAPPPPQPYSAEEQFVGVIGCSIAYDIIEGSDMCGEDARVPGNGITRRSWPIDPFMTNLVMNVDSDAGVTGKMELAVGWPKHLASLAHVRGPTPFMHTYDINKENAWPLWGELNQTMMIEVTASAEASQPQLAYQQRFVVDVGFFYNGKEVPDGYVPNSA